jgi:rSAM/selenodomain-associated transferase 1
LIVFAKAPRAGLVKTRMCPPFTPEQAAELYACMLDDVLEQSARDAACLGLEPVLAVHPPDAVPELADRAPPVFRVIRQRGDGLAARMDLAAREACAAGFERVILRGSDNPMVSLRHLEVTLDLLDRHSLVLTPDRDGGYGVVGLCAPVPGLFDHEMSTVDLLASTVDRARARGTRVAIGEDSFDLDCVADLGVLRDWLDASGQRHTCARTAAWLDANDAWPPD